MILLWPYAPDTTLTTAPYCTAGCALADGIITTFEVPGGGTSANQGTVAAGVNPAGAVTGYYFDNASVSHGLLRARDGTVTSFDAPGAGTGSLQGTFCINMNPAGAITGYYVDASGVSHGFLRTP